MIEAIKLSEMRAYLNAQGWEVVETEVEHPDCYSLIVKRREGRGLLMRIEQRDGVPMASPLDPAEIDAGA